MAKLNAVGAGEKVVHLPNNLIQEKAHRKFVPRTTEERKNDKNWCEAMRTEYNSLNENDLWKLVNK